MQDIKDEIEVIPADEPKPIKLGWTVKEYYGETVFKVNAPDAPLKNIDDLKEGDKIIVWGSCVMEVKNDGKLYGDSKNNMVVLDFDTDDRHCWIATCMINKRGLANASKGVIIGK